MCDSEPNYINYEATVSYRGIRSEAVEELRIGDADYKIIFNNFIQDYSNVKFVVLQHNKDGYIQILNSNKICFLLKKSIKREI